jgi:membrane protein DedA with SNARE-associated domain
MIPIMFDESGGSLWLIAAIILATFVSEDVTMVSVGLLINAHRINWLVGLVACFVGIFVGDLGLWMIGSLLSRGLLRWGWLNRRFDSWRTVELTDLFNRQGGWAILASRFLPGTRVPLYVTAGAIGGTGFRFAKWTALAALLWTPVAVIGTAWVGESVIGSSTLFADIGWSATIAGILAVFVGIRILMKSFTKTRCNRLIARVSRLWRWEFWPTWLFYLPVVPWLAWLSLRYRGILTWTSANPGIPQGGVVGESKYDILRQLPAHAVVPTLYLPTAQLNSRVSLVQRAVGQHRLTYPLILKPDAGQRGDGVKRVGDCWEVERYLEAQSTPVIAQSYHPGPFEAGIFYYRIPDEPTGHIFSITDKVFPRLVGDGHSTLEELIWRHPRYRMQAAVFLSRHQAMRGHVLATGAIFPLALAGNHCQGTLFRDGTHLITPELERRIDKIARQFPGFFIGRFDIRYTNPDRFAAGEDLAIVELNGVMSESTNLYDPTWSLWAAYATLCRQWELLYRIGAANRRRGDRPTRIGELLRVVFHYYTNRRVAALAD